jgi:hypothetical protein
LTVSAWERAWMKEAAVIASSASTAATRPAVISQSLAGVGRVGREPVLGGWRPTGAD